MTWETGCNKLFRLVTAGIETGGLTCGNRLKRSVTMLDGWTITDALLKKLKEA